jgi:hypothetical protein
MFWGHLAWLLHKHLVIMNPLFLHDFGTSHVQQFVCDSASPSSSNRANSFVRSSRKRIAFIRLTLSCEEMSEDVTWRLGTSFRVLE